MKSFLSFTVYRWSLYNSGLNPIKSPWHHPWSHVRPRWPSAVFTWRTPGFALAVPRMRTALREGSPWPGWPWGCSFFLGLESLQSRRMVCLCQCLQCVIQALYKHAKTKIHVYVQFWR
jgi:hypothetical protein